MCLAFAKRICRTLAAAAFGLVATHANAQLFGGGVVVCANCSTEPTQLGIQAIHDLEYAKQLLQYAMQVQQLADQIKQAAHIGPAALTNIGGDLAMLANVVQGSNALAYSLGQQDVAFRTIFPGYQPAALGSAPVPGSFQSQYQQLAATSLATTQGILRGVGVQGKLLQTEQGVLSVLRMLSASNVLDRNNAINLSGQLAAEQVGQLQKLRELLLEDMTSKAAYQGYQIQKDAASEQANQWFFNGGTVTADDRAFSPGDLP